MADYDQLAKINSENVLLAKIAVAVSIAATAILSEGSGVANHNERYAWAAKAFREPLNEARRFQMGVLAANATATDAVIRAAGDNVIQNNVNNLVDVFALSDAGAAPPP